jgi:soluble lytic murein transglycosylase
VFALAHPAAAAPASKPAARSSDHGVTDIVAPEPGAAQPKKPKLKPAAAAAKATAKPESKPAAKPAAKPGATAAKPAPAAAKPAATAKPAAKPAAPSAAKSASVPMPPARPSAAGKAPAKPVTARPTPGAPAPNVAAVPPPAAAAPAGPRPLTSGRIPNGPTLLLAPTSSTSAIDIATLKRAIELVRSRKQSEATALKAQISDPVARKLVEWAVLRSDDASSDFARYNAFISSSPGWPNMVTLRRKAEAMMYIERVDPGVVRAFFADTKPLHPKGKISLARALLAQGDRKGAEELIRETWRTEDFPADIEQKVLEQFGDFITRDDHKARMDRQLYTSDDTGAGMRAATRLGGNEPLIAKARLAMLGRNGNGKAALEAVPAAARNDVGYKFARAVYLRRAEHYAEAAALMRTIPVPLDPHHDLDEWWVERRLLARKLLDVGDAKTAYEVARDATPPTRDVYRAEHQFTAGWIALRFLHDPVTAYAHFQKVGEGSENPIALARASYWMGRAAEALRKPQEARAHYQEAARYPATYYGQIARAKAGLGESGINPPAMPEGAQRQRLAQLEVVRAMDLLYTIEARELIPAAMAGLGDALEDPGALLMLGEIGQKNEDARGMLLLGKLALLRGHAMEHIAFPTVGLPKYTPIGPPVEPALVYSITRQESWFNPKTISSARAMGYMQVTPAAGKYLAKKFKVPYDEKRLLNDNVYNLQMGSAELGDNLEGYRGSYILAFAGYNAGRGRVKEWIARYGDPRDPKVDPIDWVERIPFAETRNYVQRVMENFQVYRVRFGGSSRLMIEADLRRGSLAN